MARKPFQTLQPIVTPNYVCYNSFKTVEIGVQKFPTQHSGCILLVPSVFGRASSIFGRLENLSLLVLSSKNGRFRRPSKLSAS